MTKFTTKKKKKLKGEKKKKTSGRWAVWAEPWMVNKFLQVKGGSGRKLLKTEEVMCVKGFRWQRMGLEQKGRGVNDLLQLLFIIIKRTPFLWLSCEPLWAVIEHVLINGFLLWKCCSVAQSCPTLSVPMDCSPPGFFVHEISGKNTGVGCHFLLYPAKVPSFEKFLHIYYLI